MRGMGLYARLTGGNMFYFGIILLIIGGFFIHRSDNCVLWFRNKGMKNIGVNRVKILGLLIAIAGFIIITSVEKPDIIQSIRLLNL